MQCCWIALIKLHSRTSKLESIFSKPATTLSTEFMSFYKSFVVISHVGLVVKNLSANAGNIREVGLIPGFRKSPREGHGNPLQCMLACKIPWTEVPGGLQPMVQRAEPGWSWLSMHSTHWPEDLVSSMRSSLQGCLSFLVLTWQPDFPQTTHPRDQGGN